MDGAEKTLFKKNEKIFNTPLAIRLNCGILFAVAPRGAT